MDSKPRRVRCPRCLSVLSEPSDVLLYECGGCGAKLQAKKRNSGTVDHKSQRLDEDSSGKQKVDRVFVDQESGSSSNQQSLLNFTNESDQNSDHNDLHSPNKEKDAAKRAENDTVDAPPSVVEDCSFEKLETKFLSDDQGPCCSLDQQSLVNSSVEPDQIVHSDPRSSTEFSGHEDPESSPEATARSRKDQEQEQNQKLDQSHYQQFLNYSTDEKDQSSDYNDLRSPNKDQDVAKRAENGTVDAPPSVVENHSFENFNMKLLSDDQERCCSSNQQPPVNSSDETYQNIHNDPRSCSTEFSGQENVKLVGHEHSSGKQKINQLSGDNETDSGLTHLLLVNSRNDLDRNNDHRSSSELSYHDDTESSPEATVHTRLVKRHETGNQESCSEFEEAIANTRIVSDSDDGSKSRFGPTKTVNKLLDTRQKKPVHLDEDDLFLSEEDGSADLHRRRRFGGTSYYGYDGSVSSFDGNDDLNPIKNHIRPIEDEHVDSGNRYRFNRRKDKHRSTDIRSFYGLNGFQENPMHRSPMIPEDPKLERIELLKLVRELQDQLERTNVSNLQQVPSYYNHVLNNPGRYGRRMAFSGEATTVNRRRDGGTCHYCCSQPQDRHFSAQFPSHHICCNGPDYRANTYRSQRFSGPSSPNSNRSESNYSVTDDQRQPNHVTKPFRTTKKKKYVRPIAGGSPWITCYLCSKLLQLPQSFLLFSKRYHTLRCGGCLKVLTFTLSNGTHVSRYYPEETIVAPPSSEVEDFDKMSGSWAGPVSCSDRSFEKSYSTETDRIGSREFSEERRNKATVSRDPSRSTQMSSSKISGRRTTTSEIEEVEPGHNGSPLHWLMGYASPSKFSAERRMVAMSRDPLGSTQPLSSESSVWKTTTSEIEEIEPGHNGSPLHWLMGYAYQSKVMIWGSYDWTWKSI
ncbi:hypothetical protein E3N88_03439 [Mikania micrantha]|uniref:Uncharacterized protein n=1 Tax=Mikania micrantha TaxID=192012 RepID=A0A5N6Q6Z6_9ASTR|nr:hypothetical protein E3N88_03439 [Mikania micrantha]